MKKTSKLKLSAETIRVLDEMQLKAAAGGVTDTCLGTQCQCYPTLGPQCPSVGFTNCICSAGHSNCPACGTYGTGIC